MKLYLADPRVDPNPHSYQLGLTSCTPLSFAASPGRATIVEMLLRDERVDPSVSGQQGTMPPLAAASSLDDKTDVLRLLLGDPRVGIDSGNNHGVTALYEAALLGSSVHVRLLLGAGADVNAQMRSGRTAQHACYFRNKPKSNAVIGLLLEAPGVDVNAVNNEGRTVLTEGGYRLKPVEGV